MATTYLLGQYLNQVNGFIRARNESGLADFIRLEPPFSDTYANLIQELKQAYPKGSEDGLEQKCTQSLTAAVEGDEGSPWTPFIKFMVQYLSYLRDVSADPSKYLETYELLSELQQRANSALGHSTLGHLILPVVIRNARLVCRLAIGLDKQPELIAHLKSGHAAAGGGGSEEGGSRETLPERAANILRSAFVTCLNDRSSSTSTPSQPLQGKKRGIYTIANLCLKILFQCRKTRNATQIFENIYNLSPPLAVYPKAQRVTYLYYLGRFLFQNSHFFRAQQALAAAYLECPAQRADCVRQRRHILVYLIASNIILGRFPSTHLLARPEAAGLGERFMPLCLAIRQGNLAAFHHHLSFDGEHADWFLHFRILLQLRNRCEPLVWRSLVRKSWQLVGWSPTDPASRMAPTITLAELGAAFAFSSASDPTSLTAQPDPDFEGIDYGNGEGEWDETQTESLLSSLITQNLCSGFIAHKQGKYCITGVRQAGGNVLLAGFPPAWGILSRKAGGGEGGGDVVPGWKKEGAVARMGGVVNLSGARAVGVGA